MLKRVYKILLPEERRRGWGVAFSVFLTSLLDFAGLAALLPLLFKILNGDSIGTNGLWLCGGAALFIIVKNIMTMLLAYGQNKFLLNLYKRLSFTLFSAHYSKGLLYIREHGSIKLGHEINYNCFAFSQNLLAPLLQFSGNILLALMVTIVLVIYEPLIVVMLYGAFIPFVLFYWFGVKRRIKDIGERELNAMREQGRVVSETFKGYAEIEVNQGANTMQRAFIRGMDSITDSHLKLGTILRIPASLSELAIIVGLTLLLAFGTDTAPELLTIFAAASFRLLPALRGILSAWTQMNNALPTMEIIERGVVDMKSGEVDGELKELHFNKAIVVEQLKFGYPDQRELFNNFNIRIEKGEYIGIKGVSGSGKSTLFNILLGFIEPQQGRVLIDDCELNKYSRAAWLKKVGYVPQEVFMTDGTLAENIALGAADSIDREKIDRVLRLAELSNMVAMLPNGVDTPLRECGAVVSGGEKQRIGIARALYKGAEVLLFDEATSALDNATEERINSTIATLRKEIDGLTILSIAHRESSLNYCDRVLKLDK